MSEAPFVSVLTPLTALPVILGLAFGVEGCLTIIANNYGLDLSGVVPGSLTQGNVGAPLLLFGVAIFASVRGLQLRKAMAPEGANHDEVGSPFSWSAISWLERTCWAGALLGLATIPYWLELPLPEIFVIGGALLVWRGWRGRF